MKSKKIAKKEDKIADRDAARMKARMSKAKEKTGKHAGGESRHAMSLRHAGTVAKIKKRSESSRNEEEECSGWEMLDHEDLKRGDEMDDNDERVQPMEGKHLSKHQKKSLKRAKEEHIRNVEARRKAGLIAPTNVADFEQMVMSSPNSSYVWIQYMAFVIAQGELDRGRTLAKRALDTISFREDGERFNVWIALLNAENTYGSDETALQVLYQALGHTNQGRMYKAALDIFEQTGKEHLAEKVAKALCKNYGDIPDSWIRCIRFWLKKGASEQAKLTYDKSMQALPARHKVHMSSQAALLEFKVGDPEKGRSMMERVLQDNPRRLDLWSVYLDQEIAHGNQARARALFERCTHLALPPKKMKFLFKRYLNFEKQHGDEDKVEHVKRMAMDFVQRALHTENDDDDDDNVV